MMKRIFLILLGILAGVLIGLLIAIPLIAIIKHMSMAEAANKIFSSARFVPMLVHASCLLIAAVVAFFLQIIIHEGGHLVAGLLTGYRFVSFRFLNFTIFSRNGRLQCRNYLLNGTGGQCLLAPPDRPLEQIDTRWYNAGGVIANIVTALLAILLIFTCDLPQWVDEFLFLMALTGIGGALINGIPMKAGGIANDGSNLLQMENDLPGKQCFCNILETNARSQEGEAYRDMPERLFVLPQPIIWKNSMHVGAALMTVYQKVSMHRWEDAYQLLSEAYAHKDDMMLLYLLEVKALLTLTCIATNRDDEARQHYGKDVQEHVNKHAPTQGDKQMIAMAAALVLDGDHPRAEQMRKQLEANRDKFIHQSDVEMSLDVMRWLLDHRTPAPTTDGR